MAQEVFIPYQISTRPYSFSYGSNFQLERLYYSIHCQNLLTLDPDAASALHKYHQSDDSDRTEAATSSQAYGNFTIQYYMFLLRPDVLASQDKKRIAIAAEADISEVNLVLSRSDEHFC